jgi:hypothetical protein
MIKREGWKFPVDNADGLDEVFESLYGSKKFKAIPVSLLNQMFQWKTAEWEDKEQKVKSFQDFVNTYKDEYNYFLIYEFNEGALRMKSLLEYHKLFESVNVNPNRVIFLTSNWNFSYFYDELDYSEEDRFHIIPNWWKSIAYFTAAELRNRVEIPSNPCGQVNSVWDKLIENFENRKNRNPSKLFITTMESSRGERSYFFDKLKEKDLLKFGHVSYRDMGVYLDNKNRGIMSDVDNHYRFFDTKEYFNDAHISVVMESDVYTNPVHWDGLIQSGRLSEKTMWPLFWGKPFFVIGPHRPIDTLHKYGLKTFSPIFDEGYDTEDDILIRIDRVVDELVRLSKLSEDDLENKLQKTNEIIEYNFNFFKEWSYKGVDEIIDTFFGQRAKELNLI